MSPNTAGSSAFSQDSEGRFWFQVESLGLEATFVQKPLGELFWHATWGEPILTIWIEELRACRSLAMAVVGVRGVVVLPGSGESSDVTCRYVPKALDC